MATLPADTYTVTVTDDTTNCTDTTTITIAPPPAALDFTFTNTDVTCAANSTVTVTPIGGWGGYEYQLENTVGPVIVYPYQTDNNFADVAAGSYTIYIRDAGNCIVSKPILVDPAETPSIAVDASSDYCFDTANQASLTITITDGVAPFTYSISGGGQIAAVGNPFTISNLIPGSYDVQVMDAYGCISNVLSETIATQLNASAVVTKSLDCTVTPDATIDVNITNGYPPYATYEVSTNGGTTWGAPVAIVGSTFTYSASTAGTYDFRITDSLGCPVITQAVIDPIVSPDITSLVQTVDIICNGDNGATIVVNIDTSQGVGPFDISVLNTTTATSYGTQTAGLPAGTYEVTITDAKMCTDMETIIIAEPDPITYDVNLVPITCGGTGTNPGSISVENVAGGTPGFTYHLTGNNGYSASQIEPLGADYTFTILEFGIYEVDVVDDNGCSVLTTNIIASPPDDLDIDVSAVTANCATGGTAEVTVSTAILGTNYEFGILDTYAVPYASTYFPPDVANGPTRTFTGLTPGITYTFVVHDLTTNCYYFETAAAPINSPSSLTSSLDAVNNVTCTGSNDGTVDFTIDNYDPGATEVTYEIFNSQSNLTTGITGSITPLPAVGTGVSETNVGPLSPGVYYILYSEVNGAFAGCTVSSAQFTITQSTNELDVTANLDNNDNCNLNAGQISAIGQFGTAPYEYQLTLSTDTAPTAATWAGTATNSFNVEGGDYIVYIKDAHDCIRFDPITVPTDPEPEITLVATNQCTADEGSFSVEITLDVAGISPSMISIDGSAPQNAPALVNAGDTMIINNLSSGPHSIALIDQNGCADTDPITLYPPVNISANITAEESCVPANAGEVTVTANGGSGTYSYTQITPAGPTNATGIFAGLTHSVAYTFEVEDTTTNCTETVSITLDTPDVPNFTLAKSDVSCFGGSDGSITVTLNPGNTDIPYLYSLDGGTTTQTSNIFLGRPQGLHNVTVISDKGCLDTQAITIDQPTELDISAVASVFSCDDAASTITVTVEDATPGNPSGTGPYLYSFDGGTNFQTGNTFDVPFGSPNVTVTVEDDNGCTDTVVVPVPVRDEVTAVINRTSAAIDCNNGQETIEIVPTSASGTYTYTELPSGNPVADPTNIVLTAPGTYTYEVLDTTTNCSVVVEHVIAPFDFIDVTATVDTDATCSDSTDGVIQVTITGYTGNFDYEVLDATGAVVGGTLDSDNATSDPYVFNVSTTLGAGTYSVRIIETAFPECNDTSNNVTIDAPEPLALQLISNVNANCNASDAIVTVQASGGTGPYTYGASQSGAGVPATFTFDETVELDPSVNLNWDIYVRDANNCIIAAPLAVTVDTDTVPDIALALDDECAAEGSFGITVSLDAVNFGVAPYTMSLDGNAFESIAAFPHTYNGLNAGPHSVEIRDANGCGETENMTINAELSISAVVVTQPTCSASDGVIEFTLTGGDASNAVTLLNAGTLTDTGLVPAGNRFNGVAFGDYIVRVTDTPLTPGSCIADAPVSLEEPTPVTLLAPTPVDVTCNGADDGSITVNLQPTTAGVNDNPPYTFEITDGTSTFTQTTNLFTGLAPGTWDITVTSNRNCVATQQTTINEPSVLDISAVASVFSCDDAASTITVTVEDATPGNPSGTGPYLYSFDGGTNFQTGNTFDVPFGSPNVTVTVEDDNGCTDTVVVPVPVRDEVTAVINRTSAAIDCNNGQETIEIVPTSASGTYTYTELPSGNPVADPTNIVLTAPGTYTYEVLDTTTNCSVVVEHVIAPFDFIDVTATVDTDATCSDSTDGVIQVTITGYTGNFDYEVLDATGAVVGGTLDSDNATSDPYVFNVSTTLGAGTYSVRIIETAFPECNDTSNNVTIDAPEPLALQLISNVNANCNASDAIVTVQASGGTGPYTYGASQSGAGVPATFTFDETVELDPSVNLNWDIYVRDANNCIIAAPLAVTVDTDTVPDIALALDDECAAEGSFGITVSLDAVNFGVAPYTMSLDGNAFESIAAFPHTYNGLNAGPHSVEIRDANGCGETENMTINAELSISAVVVTQPTCSASDGVIEFTLTGGDASNAVTLLNAGTLTDTGLVPAGNRFNGVAFGDYIVRVTDTPLTPGSCIADAPVSLEEPTPVTLLAPTPVDVTCNGADDGSITVNLQPTTAGVNDNPPYTFEITDGTSTFTQTTNLFTGLAPGTWDITVTSNRNCVATQQTTINEPSVLAAAITDIIPFACDVNNAQQAAAIEVTITAGTGTPDYFYSVNGSAFQPTGGLVFTHDVNTAGNYDIAIRDANGCPFVLPTQVIDPVNTFTATVALSDAITCVNNREEVVITVTDDGNPHAYTYTLLPLGNPNGTQTGTTGNTATFELTAVGSYTFRITDTATGCYVDTAPYEIAPYDLIEVIATAVDPVICVGDDSGTLEIAISGYSGGYSYAVFNADGTPTPVSGNANTSTNPFLIPTGLSGGNYYVTVTETDLTSTLCNDDSNVITIVSPDMPLITAVTPLAPVTCSNDLGEILVDPSGGYPPYDIVLTNTTTGQIYTENDVLSFVFTGLSAGNFTVVVTDSARAPGCVVNDVEVLAPATQIVANATPLHTDLACFGDTTGTVTATVTGGGNGTYQYVLNYYDAAGTTIDFVSGGQSAPTFTGLGGGIYSVTVSDAWNCPVETNQVTIDEPTEVFASLIRTNPLTCEDGVEFELTAIGGRSGTYEYSLDNITWLPMTSNPMPLPATGTLGSGTHQYYVRDAIHLCAPAISNAITEDPIIPLELHIDDTAAFVNCNGDNTAIIYASANHGVGNYMFELYDNYAGSLADLNNLDYTQLNVANRIAGPTADGTFSGLVAGTYYVNVISGDCHANPQQVVIDEPEPLDFDVAATDVLCFGDENGTITVTPIAGSGGAGGYIYAISPNLNQFDTINTFTDLAPGDYTIIAQDQNGCFQVIERSIGEPTPITASAMVTPEICAGEENGMIDLTIGGGTAPYSTRLSTESDFVQDRVSFVNMASGGYILFVRDANGCEFDLGVTIDPGVNLNAAIEVIYECTGDSPDNYINMTFEDTSVMGDVLYALDSTDPNDLQLNPDFRNSTPGSHYIRVAHSNGCFQDISFEIEDFEPLTLTLEQFDINVITATAEGGREEYTYYFDDVNNGSDNTFRINRTDTYVVRVVDANGCEAMASIEMEFIDIEIPNFFTPDGDGQNDFWMPRNQEAFPEILTLIFDRYGREVYRLGLNDPGWDGIYNDSELPTGDYWYVIKLKGENDDREFVGHFTLYR
ncbi:T9SS type B sorting domain-containing protein [Maribacter sp. 2307UL18-2]|uniref:T9SS type B sorting domain-containing protein n=1 Tax=Maribacter sp. 2307UL18-2 TaxID=3386274 RepID=UPI0039BC3DD5